MNINNIPEFVPDDYPKPPCVYFLIGEKGEVVYVGQSRVSWMNRIEFHKEDKDFSSVRILEAPENKLDEVESKYILKYRPKYNYTMPTTDKYVSQNKLRETFDIDGWDLRKIRMQTDAEIFPERYDIEIVRKWVEENE